MSTRSSNAHGSRRWDWLDVTSQDWFFALMGAGAVTVALIVLLAVAAHFAARSHFSPELAAKTEITSIVASLDEYAINNNKTYPSTLVPLVTPDANGHCYLEGYNQKIPKDAWKHEYLYQPPTPAHPKPRVLSLGSDGAPGGEGDAADIDSDALREDG